MIARGNVHPEGGNWTLAVVRSFVRSFFSFAPTVKHVSQEVKSNRELPILSNSQQASVVPQSPQPSNRANT